MSLRRSQSSPVGPSGRYGRPMGPGVPVGGRSAERVTALFDATLIVTALVVNVRGRGLGGGVVAVGEGRGERKTALFAAPRFAPALVFRGRGRGLVVIPGCGHPVIEL